MDIFYWMTTEAYNNKDELCVEKEGNNDKPKACFGKDSRDYVRKSMAMTLALFGNIEELKKY